mgnify:FL=1
MSHMRVNASVIMTILDNLERSIDRLLSIDYWLLLERTIDRSCFQRVKFYCNEEDCGVDTFASNVWNSRNCSLWPIQRRFVCLSVVFQWGILNEYDLDDLDENLNWWRHTFPKKYAMWITFWLQRFHVVSKNLPHPSMLLLCNNHTLVP